MASKARCENCKSVIESKSRHDFVSCVCGKIFVDGGNDYFRCGYENPEDITFIYEDGREESGTDSIRQYKEKQYCERREELTITGTDKEAPLTEQEKTNLLLQQVIDELKEVKRLIIHENI